MHLIKHTSNNDPELLDEDLFSSNDFVDDEMLIQNSNSWRQYKNRLTNIPWNSALEKPLVKINDDREEEWNLIEEMKNEARFFD